MKKKTAEKKVLDKLDAAAKDLEGMRPSDGTQLDRRFEVALAKLNSLRKHIVMYLSNFK